uniref:Uncharacterized protein n=1 Tax=Rhizophora mucronata TaxID=61149 RepID=A0A2P2QBP9_RHIMU
MAILVEKETIPNYVKNVGTKLRMVKLND